MVVTIAIIAAVLIVAGAVLLALAARDQMRRRRLRARFGPEYERLVEDTHSRREAEHELAERERRHAELPLRRIPADVRDRYAEQWLAVQELFVDDPVEAVGEGDRLVVALMADRGYPAEGYQQQLADLSVQHADTLQDYRAAHDISDRAIDGTATTEDLRQAMVHYRSLFEELLGDRVRVDPGNPA
jgi:hypothetical protein